MAHLELFSAVEGISILEHTNVVFGELVDDLTCNIHLTESEFVVVTIVKNIHEIGIERVDILDRVVDKSRCQKKKNRRRAQRSRIEVKGGEEGLHPCGGSPRGFY